jgi:hypothetical protein
VRQELWPFLVRYPEGLSWRIVNHEPVDASDSEKDATIWVWEIEREGMIRYVNVTITLPSLVNAGIPGEVRSARESKGRTAVEAYLDEDEPPHDVLVSTQGIST